MQADESKIFTKFYGEKLATESLNIDNFNEPITFDIYDGHAVCFDHNGKRYDMFYPRMQAVKESKELQDAIIEYVDTIEKKEDITVLHILMTFNELFEDGVEIAPTQSETN